MYLKKRFPKQAKAKSLRLFRAGLRAYQVLSLPLQMGHTLLL